MNFYRIYIALLLFASCTSNSSLVQDSNSRIKLSLNNEWKFSYTNENMLLSDISDSNWKNIKLPHTWNINDTPNDTTMYKRGIGWYKKELHLSSELLGKRIFLNFEGANQIAELFVNGELVGKHIGGYTSFSFDITEYLKFDNRENTNSIAVKVDNSFNKNVAPLSADFTFYGGIYRDVWLISTNAVHFSFDDFGSKGIYISTPKVSKDKATVQIRGKVVNQSKSDKNILVKSTLLNKNNEIVSHIENSLKIGANQQKEFSSDEVVVDKPELWSPENPNLYSIKTEIFEEGKLMDEVINPLGFRFFTLDADKGFFLNGEPLKLVGTNRHQDYEGLGNALSDSLHIRDLEMIKEAGFNFLRLAHYPQDPSVLHAADRLGLIIWEEIPIVNYVTASEEFLENSKYMLTEMVRQHYNHPSIIFWGYMNEVYLHDANGNRNKEMVFPEEYLDWTVKLADKLNDLVHAEDPNRITVMATHQNEMYDKTDISSIPDALGYNLYQGWYSNYFEDFGNYVDYLHLEYPNRKILISEYGAGSDERIHSYKPQRFDFSTEYQQSYHESYLKQIIERPFIGASAVWCQSDFGSNKRGDSKPQVNQKGLQYFNRKPKDIYYHYQSFLSSKPVVHIASHDWGTRVIEKGNIQNTHPIKIYSNISKLEIYIDGEKHKSINVDDSNIVEFDFIPTDCKHNIEVRGEIGDKIISDNITLTFIDSSNFLSKQNCLQKEIAINIGSEIQFMDDSGRIWLMDQKYIDNSWGYLNDNSRNKKFTKGIIGSENDPIYQFYREGIESYHFDVEEGIYEVEIYLAEFEFLKAGKRVMDININNEKVWRDLDIADEFGNQTAVSRKFKVNVDSEKGINISLKAQKGKTILNGLSVKKL